MNATLTGIFRRGSTTFYNSSRFFPADVRAEVTALYAFVRLADDFVDALPQDGEGFAAFRREYESAASGDSVEHPVIRAFVELAQRRRFEREWVDCFLDTMAQDLWKRDYATLEETLQYTNGSAEVVGLMMARVMGLSPDAEPYARLLGRAFQYVNFIRDTKEDALMGRTYLPRDEMREAGLRDLSPESAERHPEAFNRYVRAQIARYRAWQREGAEGFRFIPANSLAPIRTAAAMYEHTARVIERNPLVVFQRKVKPSKTRVLYMAGKVMLADSIYGHPFYKRSQGATTGEANAHT